MIIGTAGHIDHGKTTLVRALTGVDTDRLPEEKKRGISIELGYAFLDAGPGRPRIGFIDVPGHERLVHTMLAGATGIDHALLLVAADDGVMPQTLEHLAVLALLGVASLDLVITKCDRVEAGRVAEVSVAARALLAQAGFEAVQAFEVSAPSGQGVDALRAHLLALAGLHARPVDPHQAFRLAVDRAFSLDGIGTVATGTVHAGRVSIGDELLLVPPRPGQPPLRGRVRSLHAQNMAVTQAEAGQRCAIGLAGVDKQDVARGQWWVGAAVAAAVSARFDVRLRLLAGEARALRSGCSVHVHLGAAAVMASVAVLEVDSLAPGESGLVQLLLHAPLAVCHGDRVVLRDAAASRTLAGGLVLDPFGPSRYRRTPQRLAELQALFAATPQARLDALLTVAPQGLDLRPWAAAQGLNAAGLDALRWPAAALNHADGHSHLLLGTAQSQALRERALGHLRAYHAAHPDELGPELGRWRRLAAPRLAEPLWRALLRALQADGSLALRGAFAHLPEHGVSLSLADQRIAQKIAPLLAQARFEGGWARDLARAAQEPEPLTRTSLARLAQGGELHQVVKDLYYPAAVMTELAALARRSVDAGELRAAAFRDATGLGRKRAIQVLEYFDRIGLLRRVGDAHKLRADSAVFAEISR